jgi:heat shock protein HslJ
MRNVTIAAFCACAVLAGCASGGVKQVKCNPQSTEPGTIMEIDWFLVEIQTADALVDLNRPKLAAESMGDVFSLRFTGEGETRVSGKAAPNRYSAPCQWGDGNTLTIGLTAATRMLAFKEPDALKEQEFFTYLSAVNHWEISPQGRLELTTRSGATLVFEK